MAMSVVSCSQKTKISEHRGEHREKKEGHNKRELGEHERDKEGDKASEESGTEYTLTDRYHVVKYGARLSLAYDANSNSFKGMVENVSNKTLERVRVEIHLSNGKELGPTSPENLAPGQKREITLQAGSKYFSGWSAHAEVGNMEHASEGGEGHEGRESGEGHEEGEGHEVGGDGSSSPITSINKSYKGVIDGLEVDMSYDAKTKSITGTIKNLTSKKMCFVQTEHHLKLGKRTVGEMRTEKVGDLNPGEKKKSASYFRKKDESRLKNGAFDGYVIHLEVFECGGSGPKTHREGNEEHGKRERKNEHGKKEGSGEHN